MFANVTLSLMGGFVTTIQLFCLTLVFALPLGLIISFGSMSRFTPLRALVKTVVWAVRGTPLMLQIIVIFYGPALLWGMQAPRFGAALLSFVINYACYFSEIFRGGIQAIPNGQYEAGRTIAVYEVLWMGEKFIKSKGIIWPLFYTAVFYLVFNGLLTLLFGWIEKKMDYFK